MKTVTTAEIEEKNRQIEKYESEITKGDTVSKKKERISYIIKQICEINKGAYLNASVYKDHSFKEGFERIVNAHWRGTLRADEKVREELKKIYEWYSDSENHHFHDGEGKPTSEYRFEIAAALKELSDSSKKDFSIQELNMLETVVSYMKHSIEHYNKIYRNGKWVAVKPVANEYAQRMKAARALRGGVVSKITRGKYQQFFGDSASVVRAADGYDPDGFYTRTFEEIRAGALGAAVTEMELRSEYERFLKSNKKYLRRLTEETVTYRGEQISVADAISLYMTHSRREAWAALVKSGFVIDVTVKHGDSGKTRRVEFGGLDSSPDAAKKQYSQDQLNRYIAASKRQLEAGFTETDKKFIELLEETYKKCAPVKERVDMERLGYSNVLKNTYYYPIRRADISKNTEDMSFLTEVDRASSMSFNKETVRSAGRLLIEPANTVIDRHVRGISLYANLAIVTENLNRILNVSLNDNHLQPRSVRTEMEKTEYGRDMYKYLMKLKADVEGLREDKNKIYSSAVRFLRSGYARAALGANPKVWVTQLTSLFAATNVLDYESVVKGMGVSNVSAEVDKYCKLAQLRNSDKSIIKAQTVTDKVDSLSNALMFPIGMVDRFVVTRLFGACQVEVEKKQGLKLGTEKNKKAAGELLTRVILETQQNSLVTERSAAMRSSDEFSKSITMFSADSMKNVGRFIDSVGEANVIKMRTMLLEKTGKSVYSELQADLEMECRDIEAELEELKAEQAKQEKENKVEGIQYAPSGGDLREVRGAVEQRIAELESDLVQKRALIRQIKNEPELLREQYKSAQRKVARSASSLFSSAVFMALVSFGFKWLYAKTREEEPEELMTDVAIDAVGNMLGGLPVMRDVYSLLAEGYEMDTFLVSCFNDVLGAAFDIINLASEAMSGKEVSRGEMMKKLRKMAYAMGQLFGIPVRNVYNLLTGVTSRVSEETGYRINSVFYDSNYSSDLKSAISKDDVGMISTITSLMLKDGSMKYSSSAETAISGLLGEGYSVLPCSVGDTVSYNGETVELTARQRRDIQSAYRLADEQINKLVRLQAFSNASSDVRARAIRFINELYMQMALSSTLGYGDKNKAELFAMAIDAYRLAIIFATAQSISADKDVNGNTVSGSKRKKIEQYIESQQLTAAQKYMLMGMLGYKNSKGQEKVTAYISTLKLTKDEKRRLLSYSGYGDAA